MYLVSRICALSKAVYPREHARSRSGCRNGYRNNWRMTLLSNTYAQWGNQLTKTEQNECSQPVSGNLHVQNQ